MDFTIEHFWDDIEGGFFDLADFKRGSVGLEEADKPIQDSPTPGTNSLAALTLDRLFYLTHREEYRDKAEQTLKLFGLVAGQYGLFASTYFLALDQHLNPPAHAVIVGPDSDPLTQTLWKKALATYRPHKIVSLYDPEKSDPSLLSARGAGHDVQGCRAPGLRLRRKHLRPPHQRPRRLGNQPQDLRPAAPLALLPPPDPLHELAHRQLTFTAVSATSLELPIPRTSSSRTPAPPSAPTPPPAPPMSPYPLPCPSTVNVAPVSGISPSSKLSLARYRFTFS